MSPRLENIPPGPRGFPILGLLRKAWRNPPRFFLDAALRYGDVVSLPLGFHRAYLISHPEHIKHVLADHHVNYRKNTARIETIKPLFGDGLTTSEGELWRRQRHVIQLAFHRERIAELAAVITDATQAMLERWHSVAADGRPLDMVAEMVRLTRGIALKALFGVDPGDGVDGVERALALVLAHINHSAWAFINVPEGLPTPRNRRFRRALRTLDQFVYGLIDERRGSGANRGDLLSMLLGARDHETGEGMGHTQLRDEVMTMFVAGHQTTANALAWTWTLLSRHPDAACRLRSELRTVLGGRTPTYRDLADLPYTRMVIEEAMRLYPPTWILGRRPVDDDAIGGYRIPANAVVLLSPYVTHRHPAFWEKPETFDPDRFMPERVVMRPRYAYFPFGGGPRVCVGKNFAMMEAQLILAAVAQRYRVHSVPGCAVEPQAMMTLQPRNGVMMTLGEHDVRGWGGIRQPLYP